MNPHGHEIFPETVKTIEKGIEKNLENNNVLTKSHKTYIIGKGVIQPTFNKSKMIISILFNNKRIIIHLKK